MVTIVLSEAATRGVLYKKVFLKFAKFTGKHLCQSLFFNKFAGAADVFTYRLNLKIFEHSLWKVNETFEGFTQTKSQECMKKIGRATVL